MPAPTTTASATASPPADAASGDFVMPGRSATPTMAAIAFTGSQQAELVDWPCPATPLADDELTGDTIVSLVSPGTELAIYAAERAQPILTGYAAVFIVTARGAGVTTIALGQRVFCMGGHHARQRCRIRDCLPLPPGLDPAVAVFCRLVGVSWSTLVTTTARPPDHVLVTGLGPVGVLAAQLFSSAGYQVTAVDPQPARRQLAQSLGLSDVRSAVPTAASELPGPLQLALECSGHERAVIDCCQLVAKRAEVVMIGVPWAQRCDASAFAVLHAVFHRYVVLRSGWEWELPRLPEEFRVGSIQADLHAALRWLAEGRIRVDGLAWEVAPADCQGVYQDLRHGRSSAPTAIVRWSGAAAG